MCISVLRNGDTLILHCFLIFFLLEIKKERIKNEKKKKEKKERNG